MASITIPLSSMQLAAILGILSESPTSSVTTTSQPAGFAEASSSDDPIRVEFNWTSAQQFRELLRGQTEQLVRFVVRRGAEFFNDELADELGFENPAHTSSVLGKITGKLRRIGVRAEGHRHTNWYTTHRDGRRTLLRVRPDVLELFREAFQESEE